MERENTESNILLSMNKKKILEKQKKLKVNFQNMSLFNKILHTISKQIKEKSYKQTILVAGHDLKFIEGIIEKLQNDNYKVLIDQWKRHDKHSAYKSRKLLKQADIIICEWCLGNAVWYSHNKLSHQKLIVRFHRQEIETTYPEKIKLNTIDKMVFVGPHYLRKALKKYGWRQEDKFVLIGNYVLSDTMNLPKDQNAKFHLGIVGIVPKMKRLDRALDILKELRKKDTRFQLYIKGKTAKDFPWMKDRPEELEYYEKQDEHIGNSHYLKEAVHFDGFGKDMPIWYQKIGFILSVSDFESFHLTVADGASSGAIPIILKWEGSDEIYPKVWSLKSIDEAVNKILTLSKNDSKFAIEATQCQEYVQKFNLNNIYNEWSKLLKV